MSNQCPFCEMVSTNSARILKEGVYVYATLSNPRLMPGHVLIIPKRHVCKIGDLNEGERKELIEFVVFLQEKILSTVADGCDIVQNYRPFLKADNYHKVDHLHIHLRPRHIDDVFQTQIRPQYLKAFEDLKEDEFNMFKKLIFE